MRTGGADVVSGESLGRGGGVGSALQERPVDPEQGMVPEPEEPQRIKREIPKSLFIQPVLIAIALGAWAIWRACPHRPPPSTGWPLPLPRVPAHA